MELQATLIIFVFTKMSAGSHHITQTKKDLDRKGQDPFFGAGNRSRTCTCKHQILSLARLPIPPYPQIGREDFLRGFLF